MAQIDEPLQGSLQVCAGQGLLTSFSAMVAPEWRCRVIYIPQVTHIHRRTREWMLYCNFLLDNSRHCHLWLELRRNLSRSVANTTQDVDTRQRSSSSGVRFSNHFKELYYLQMFNFSCSNIDKYCTRFGRHYQRYWATASTWEWQDEPAVDCTIRRRETACCDRLCSRAQSVFAISGGMGCESQVSYLAK